MKNITKFSLMILTIAALTGCKTYSQTGKWAPDSANYTISIDEEDGAKSHYFGVGWSLKD